MVGSGKQGGEALEVVARLHGVFPGLDKLNSFNAPPRHNSKHSTFTIPPQHIKQLKSFFDETRYPRSDIPRHHESQDPKMERGRDVAMGYP